MGATWTGSKTPQTRHGLIALLAIRQARAIRERREREDAERLARKAGKTEAAPRQRGWFR